MESVWSEDRRGKGSGSTDHRTPFEHDYDRLLFSTPVRRLSDKTQVWPLDRNDGVRTRLTHSHEVSNLAKSMGKRLLKLKNLDFEVANPSDVILPILSSTGLAHDLGNPPFGHQGEAAIGRWFEKNQNWIFTHGGSFETDEGEMPAVLEDVIPERCYDEFLEFEGNAQTVRLVSKLQVSPGREGLDLTAGTLAALMKYTVPANGRKKKSEAGFNASMKKYGYFECDSDVVDWVREKTGLKKGQRHPLTWLMEAADDIAYSVLDIEDAMKKDLISPDDVLADLIHHKNHEEFKSTILKIKERFEKSYHAKRSISATRDIKASYLRTTFIQSLIDEAVDNYAHEFQKIKNNKQKYGLLDNSLLCEYLKKLATDHAFQSKQVLELEAEGAVYIDRLMDFFWEAISDREDFNNLISSRCSARAAYGFKLISDNYLEVACNDASIQAGDSKLPVRYRELRLLTDMISGMTDGFAREVYEKVAENA